MNIGDWILDREAVVDLARSLANEGFLCSESVLLAISELLGIRSELIPKIATGFGAGVGGQGEVCGAVSGGILGLGLKFGRNETKKENVKPYWFATDFLKRVKTEVGNVSCKELTGCDFNTESGRKRYIEEEMWETKCRQLIAMASGIAFDLISEWQSPK